MGRKYKTKNQEEKMITTISLPQALAEKLKTVSEEENVFRSVIVIKALREYFRRRSLKKESGDGK